MQIDLHGAEVIRLDRQRPPIRVGATAVVGLVGSAPGSRGGDAASRTFGVGNAAVTVTADAVGPGGNAITVALVDPAANSSALAVAAAGQDITATLATNAGGAITTTGLQLVAAINGNAAAGALVTAALAAGSTGASVVVAAAAAALAGGAAEPFPLGTPALLGAAYQVALLGEAGALPAAVRDVYRTAGQAGATVVVVRTADDTAAKLAGVPADRTGCYALLGAESATGQRPRLIAAPGAQDAVVTTALAAVAADLHAIAAVTVDAATPAAAIAAAPGTARLLALWPKLVVTDGADEVVRPADALALGHLARTDREHGFSASPSNRILRGVLRTDVAVDWTIDGRTRAANLLNRAHVTTAIRRGAGVYLWGNRLGDGSLISRQRTDDIISDRMIDAVLDYLDRKVDLPFVEHILGRLNGYLRTLVINGEIRSGRAWFDPAANTVDTLAAGQVTFSTEITPHDVAEHIVIRSSVGSVPNAIIEQFATAGANG